MAVCSNCGVEYDESMGECPLCSGDGGKHKPASPADVLDITKKENKQQLWELSLVLVISAMIITLAIDFVFGKGIKWSLYTSASFAYIGILLSAFHFFRKMTVIFAVLTTATLLLLLTISLLTATGGWFIPVALPVTIAAFGLIALALFLNSLSQYKGLNLIATIFIAMGLISVVVEICIDSYFSGKITLQWSVVTAASLLILAMILVFIHYRLKKGRGLERLFHV